MHQPTSVTDRIKRLIVERLDISTPAGFDESTPLFKGGVEMDSFAAVELITLIESDFSIEFDVADIKPEHFTDIKTLGRLVERYLPRSSS
jgi:acyl carrier protein